MWICWPVNTCCRHIFNQNTAGNFIALFDPDVPSNWNDMEMLVELLNEQRSSGQISSVKSSPCTNESICSFEQECRKTEHVWKAIGCILKSCWSVWMKWWGMLGLITLPTSFHLEKVSNTDWNNLLKCFAPSSLLMNPIQASRVQATGESYSQYERHSAETPLLKVTNVIMMAAGERMLVVSDLSSASAPVNQLVGICGSALDWFSCCFADREFFGVCRHQTQRLCHAVQEITCHLCSGVQIHLKYWC